MNAVDGYRAKAWECLSLAENMNDPERRADVLRFARLWMEWYRATQARFPIPPGTGHVRFGNLGELRPNVTRAEAVRLQELITAAFALLPDSGVGAA